MFRRGIVNFGRREWTNDVGLWIFKIILTIDHWDQYVSPRQIQPLHKVLLVCIACDLVLARIWSNFNCINQPNTYINKYNPVVFTIAVNKSVWIIINLILQSMKSELLRTLLFPSVVNGFSWVKIRLKLSLFRNIFIKTKSFTLLLTTQLGLRMSYIGCWVLSRVEHSHWSRSLEILCSDWLNLTMLAPRSMP